MEPREGPQSPLGDPRSSQALQPQSPQSPAYGAAEPPGGWERPPPAAHPAVHSGPLAGWGRRVGATLLDLLIVGVPALLVTGLLGVGVAGASATDSDAGLVATIAGVVVSALVFFVIALIYAPLTMMRKGTHNGQTFGKQVVGIRVIRTSGEPMDFLFSALREVVLKNLAVGLASSFTFGIAYLVNFLWPLWDGENRALHDMAAATRVVSA